MNRKFTLFLSAFVTAFVLVGLGIVIMTVRSAEEQSARLATQNTASVSPTQPAIAAQAASPKQVAVGIPVNQNVPVTVQIASAEAAQRALNSAPGALLLTDPELVDFQGAVTYEVSLNAGKVYIDASSGAVVFSNVTQAQAQPNTWQSEGNEELRSGHHEHEQHEEDENHERDES